MRSFVFVDAGALHVLANGVPHDRKVFFAVVEILKALILGLVGGWGEDNFVRCLTFSKTVSVTGLLLSASFSSQAQRFNQSSHLQNRSFHSLL